ncbi:hypothetical protein ABL78_3323 [Leptomonas seymouri]|uniref:Uncharacterized protein n=1 Tax=Leptomonas seymouri TaxID=5684 RepID=A0A0N1I7Z8_LEPSE|nr:hypothetical protein ABL78_3323 [Leptomonas seymouri]|eukprot:KPI87614.1 hypothetical protein ABL78_3323 [Leptomonas seymouri]
MNPLDYTSTDAFIRAWAPPTNAVRSPGPHICIVHPHFARVAIPAADPAGARQTAPETKVMCTGRVRTQLPTPHAGSCPLDYTTLFVTLHRRQREKILQVRAGSLVPLLGRTHTLKSSQLSQHSNQMGPWPPAVVGAAAGRAAPPSQNAEAAPAREAAHVPRTSTSAYRAVIPEGLMVVERVVPESVAAVMAQVTASATTTVAQQRMSHASPHHHHHRPSAETRAPPAQHHHHHYHAQSRRPTQQQHPSPVSVYSPQTAAPVTVTQHMRYRVGRSGSTQLQALPAANSETAFGGTAVAHRRSASPTSSPPLSASTSLPREAPTTPLSPALTSIRRSDTHRSFSIAGVDITAAAATALMGLPRSSARASNQSSLHRSGSHAYHDPMNDGGNADAAFLMSVASAQAATADSRTRNTPADACVFLRPPQHSLRDAQSYSRDGTMSAGDPLARSPSLAGTAAEVDAVLASHQRELHLQLHRTLQRQRRLEQRMLHDGDCENSISASEEEEDEDFDKGTGWEDGLGDDVVDEELFWRSPQYTQALLAGAATNGRRPSPEDQLQRPVPREHRHEPVSRSRFREPRGDESDLGIRADSVLDVPREWRVVDRGRGVTTSPSPQPDAYGVRWQRRQQRRGGRGGGDPHPRSQHHPSGSAATTEGSPIPMPATARAPATAHRQSTNTATLRAAAVSRSAVVTPTSPQRGGSTGDTDAATAGMPPPTTALLRYASPARPRDGEVAPSVATPLTPGVKATSRYAGAADVSEHNGTPRSVPSPAFVDMAPGVTLWKTDSVDRPMAAAAATGPAGVPSFSKCTSSSPSSSSPSPSWRRSSPQINERSSFARTRRPVEAVDDDDVEELEKFSCRQSSPSPVQLHEEVVMAQQQGAGEVEKPSSETTWKNAREGSVASPSLPASCRADSASHAVRCVNVQRAASSCRSFCLLDEADSEVPTVRRTSPGVSESSSQLRRPSADHSRNRSCGSQADDAAGIDDEERTSSSGCISPSHRASAVSSPSSPPHRSPEDAKMLCNAIHTESMVATPQTVAPRSAAAAVPPLVYLSDMLRLSPPPDRDNYNSHENGNAHHGAPTTGAAPHQPASRYFGHVDSPMDCTACESGAIVFGVCRGTPQRPTYFSERTAAEERSAMATASISSSPPSPNRTAIRHAVCTLTDDDADQDEPHHSPMSGQPVLSRHSLTSSPTSAAFTTHVFTPPKPTAVAHILALSMDERDLHASTASTVVCGVMASTAALSETPAAAFAHSRFSDDSSRCATTPTAAADVRLTSATSTRSSVSAVFSTPAQTRLQSLLQASTWAVPASPQHEDDDVEADDVEGDGMRTPRCHVDLRSINHSHPRHSSALSSPATPLEASDDHIFRCGTGEPGAAAGPPSTTVPPPPFAAMALPPPSPFRGSGSFLRVQPSWGMCPNAAVEGRPSDSFEADIQLLARMTRMTVGAHGPTAAPQPPPAYLSTPTQNAASWAQQQAPSLPSSPSRFSTNSLTFFTAAAAAGSPTGTGLDDDDHEGVRGGSGVYGSAVASRRSWAPRKARPTRRDRQRRTRASASGGGSSDGAGRRLSSSFISSRQRDPYHELRLSSELASPSPSARPSRGGSSSGILLPPQRLTFGSAITSLSTQLASTATATEGISDSGERWSTARSTPMASALARQQQQPQPKLRSSPPSYFEAIHAPLTDPAQHVDHDFSEADEASGEGLYSPSLPPMYYPHAQRMHPSSMSPFDARTPSRRPSLSSAEFFHAPRCGLRGDRRRSCTPSYPPMWNGVASLASSPFRQRSLSKGDEGNEHHVAASGGGGYAPPRRSRRASHTASLSRLRSPSATGTRLTWGTTPTASSEARQRSLSSHVHFSSGSTTPLRVPQTRTSGLLIARSFAPPPPPPSATPLHSTETSTTATQPLTLADELRSFSSPIFCPPPPPSSSSVLAVAAHQRLANPAAAAPVVAAHPATTFLASPPRRSGVQLPAGTPSFLAAPHGAGAGSPQTSLPPGLQALLMRGSPATAVAAGGQGLDVVGQEPTTPPKTTTPTASTTDEATSSPPMKTPPHRRGCSERCEVNVEYGAASPSPSRQASP